MVDSRELFNVVCLLQNFIVRYRFVINARYHKSKQLETKHFEDAATIRVPFSQLIFSNFFFTWMWELTTLQPASGNLKLSFHVSGKSQTIGMSLFSKKGVARALVGWGGGEVLPFISHIGIWFLPFWSENGYRLCSFWSGFGYGFRGINYRRVWTHLSFQFQMSNREREICQFEIDF